jgi:hypothetical protein
MGVVRRRWRRLHGLVSTRCQRSVLGAQFTILRDVAKAKGPIGNRWEIVNSLGEGGQAHTFLSEI